MWELAILLALIGLAFCVWRLHANQTRFQEELQLDRDTRARHMRELAFGLHSDTHERIDELIAALVADRGGMEERMGVYSLTADLQQQLCAAQWRRLGGAEGDQRHQ